MDEYEESYKTLYDYDYDDNDQLIPMGYTDEDDGDRGVNWRLVIAAVFLIGSLISLSFFS